MGKKNATQKPKGGNFVAKYMNQFNKSAVFRDKKNDYRRTPKHKTKFYDAVGLVFTSSWCQLGTSKEG